MASNLIWKVSLKSKLRVPANAHKIDYGRKETPGLSVCHLLRRRTGTLGYELKFSRFTVDDGTLLCEVYLGS